MKRTALICGPYRYALGREWSERGPWASFIMLNPSTADALDDDPTIRRCIGFAQREGMAGMVVVNLFAYRATDPRDLLKARDPFGPANFGHLIDAMAASLCIVGWGANKVARRPLDMAHLVADEAEKRGCHLKCLGVNKDGSPKHPLYVHSDAPLVPWEEYL